jgi:hypothetical protein
LRRAFFGGAGMEIMAFILTDHCRRKIEFVPALSVLIVQRTEQTSERKRTSLRSLRRFLATFAVKDLARSP